MTGIRVRVLVLAAVVWTAAACGAPAAQAAPSPAPRAAAGTAAPHRTLAVGSRTHTLTVGGRSRTFIVHRPAHLADPAPLVMMLHGGGGSAAIAERDDGWDAEADRGGFVVVYPNGVAGAWDTGGGCCGLPARTHVDDVAFLSAVVTNVESAVPVDRSRVYVTGMSNGGIMAYTLACRTDLFAAIGPVSATLLGPCPDPKPASVIHIHGTADTNIPYDGGAGAGVAHIDGPPIPSVIADWRRVDRCPAPTVTTTGTVTTSAAACPDHRAVELITLTGATHQWPGGAGHQQPMGAPAALNATATIWAFFAAHPRAAG